MPARFDLVIVTAPGSQQAGLRLLDEQGNELATRRTDFAAIPAGKQRGLFDLRRHLRLYVDPDREAQAAAEIGVCIAEEVLGEKIFRLLWQPEHQRTLRIQLPGAGDTENPLAAALARIPWEIARPKADEKTLGERNLVVRVVHDMQAPASQPLELGPDETLRALFVFAEARGSRPLGARQERRELLQLFKREVYPKRRVAAHFLSHGVTRERLKAQIQQHGGYHLVHWSGHGHLNRLELSRPDREKDFLSGADLLDLFTGAGGFLPRLVFLSACHSGGIAQVKDWDDFLALAQGREPAARETTPGRDLDLNDPPGFTGLAHALLQGGVPAVVAMRYEVGDDYARLLAVDFYRALLAYDAPQEVAAALGLARQALLRHPKGIRFAVADHATPLLYGTGRLSLAPPAGRSPALNPRNPRLHAIAELTAAYHEHFVGRTWELAGLGAGFIGDGAGAKPAALVTGLGGMGKSALAAEALDLWADRFEWVLLYQAKPNPLGFEATLRDIHLKLIAELGRYHGHIRAYPADALYREADEGFNGPGRLERLTQNLLRALRDEPILLVLDNFETHLTPQPAPADPDATPRWPCQDPAWERCLSLLAQGLAGSGSRLLVTSRRPLAALPDAAAHGVRLGPLPAGEAALYLGAHPVLIRMAFGDAAERKLARRLLDASRFHPLLMDRLARLAAAPGLRPQLMQALEALEQRQALHHLPALFAAVAGAGEPDGYLEEALRTSLDQLLEQAGPEARHLLWMIALANEPVEPWLLAGVWGEVATGALPPQSLLDRLLALGLADALGADPEPRAYTCHELVREGIRDWPRRQGETAGPQGWDEAATRLAYAGRLETVFHTLLHQDGAAALQAGARALVYCVQAQAWERLGGFASTLVTGSSDPRLLDGLLPHLQTAAEAAPEGEPRWRCLGYLGDALARGGRPDAALPWYGQAAAQARAVAEAGAGEGARQAWADLAWISGNWANALGDVGDLVAARRRYREAAEAERHAGSPLVQVIRHELETLRIGIKQGRVEEAMPEVEVRLAQIAGWWQRHRAGEALPEAPDPETLARAYISALDIAEDGDRARKAWPAALGRLEAALAVKQALQRPPEEIGRTRFNRAVVLTRLPERLAEARAELEACLALFQHDPIGKSKVLSTLANLFYRQGDPRQAVNQERRALALREGLPNPGDRAISHNNLALYLEDLGGEPDRTESARHQLAALAYRLVAGLGQDLQTSLHNYAVRFRLAQATGRPLAVPRLAELLAGPAFQPLELWLRQRGVNRDELQGTIDQHLEQVRQVAEGSP